MQIALETSLEGTYRDLNILTRLMALPQKRTLARELLRVSPHAPLAPAVLIENDWWEDVEPKAAGWEKAFARHPTVQLALGQRYAKMKKYDDAERCLRATIELSPEYRAYQALADVYAARGRFDRWQATLDDYLEQEDIGLDHARVRVEIANALMARGDYKAARPYAEAAGETWAQWAMRCAADCTEALGDWDRSEMWIRRIAERYESPLEWYCWCHRTGRGDLAAARRADPGQPSTTTPTRSAWSASCIIWTVSRARRWKPSARPSRRRTTRPTACIWRSWRRRWGTARSRGTALRQVGMPGQSDGRGGRDAPRRRGRGGQGQARPGLRSTATWRPWSGLRGRSFASSWAGSWSSGARTRTRCLSGPVRERPGSQHPDPDRGRRHPPAEGRAGEDPPGRVARPQGLGRTRTASEVRMKARESAPQADRGAIGPGHSFNFASSMVRSGRFPGNRGTH